MFLAVEEERVIEKRVEMTGVVMRYQDRSSEYEVSRSEREEQKV